MLDQCYLQTTSYPSSEVGFKLPDKYKIVAIGQVPLKLWRFQTESSCEPRPILDIQTLSRTSGKRVILTEIARQELIYRAGLFYLFKCSQDTAKRSSEMKKEPCSLQISLKMKGQMREN